MSIACRLERNGPSIRRLIVDAGAVPPALRRRQERHLSLTEREEISRGSLLASRCGLLLAGWNELRRQCRESWRVAVATTGIGRLERIGRRGNGLPPQRCKMVTNPVPRQAVEDQPAVRWSPRQISDWLRHTYSGVEEMQVSHETRARCEDRAVAHADASDRVDHRRGSSPL